MKRGEIVTELRFWPKGELEKMEARCRQRLLEGVEHRDMVEMFPSSMVKSILAGLSKAEKAQRSERTGSTRKWLDGHREFDQAFIFGIRSNAHFRHMHGNMRARRMRRDSEYHPLTNGTQGGFW